MTDQSTTETVNADQAPINDQATLEEALKPESPAETETPEGVSSEPTQTTEEQPSQKEELILGKYKSVNDLTTAYNSLRDQYRKTVEQQKELKKQLEGREIEKLKGASYEEQLDYLIQKTHKQEAFMEELLGKMQGQSEETSVQQDKEAIDQFISSNPLLQQTGLAEEFELIATHPSMREYTLESIYNARLRPKVEKLMGTKITTKERKVLSSKPAQAADTFADVSNMSKAEYEKYRQKIFSSIGTK